MSKSAEVIAVMDAVFDAYERRDAAAVASAYDREAVIFDLAPPLAKRQALEAIKAWLAGWSGPVTHEVEDLNVAVSDGLAYAHGLVRVTARTAEGEDAQWWMRLTACLRRVAGTWTIMHEHTSVPFYMDGSYRAAIDLEP